MKGGGHHPPARIEVRLRELSQLFNSMDPSPFQERDLDDDAERFIVSWAQESGHRHGYKLTVHVTTPPTMDRAEALDAAVRHFFVERAAYKRREFRQLMRRGRLSLLVGLGFLTGCLLAAGLVQRWVPGTAGAIVTESLTIGGWVAMWRPLQTYLYDWWPLRDEWLTLRELSRMKVHLVTPAGTAAPEGEAEEGTSAVPPPPPG